MKILYLLGDDDEGRGELFYEKVKEKLNVLVESEFRVVRLQEYQIQLCLKCKECIKYGKCPLDSIDQLNKIKDYLYESDIIIFASALNENGNSINFDKLTSRFLLEQNLMRFGGSWGFVITFSDKKEESEYGKRLSKEQMNLGIKGLKSYNIDVQLGKLEMDEIIKDMEHECRMAGGFSSIFLEENFYKIKRYFLYGSPYEYEKYIWDKENISSYENFAEYIYEGKRKGDFYLEKKPFENMLNLQRKVQMTEKQENGCKRIIEDYLNYYWSKEFNPRFQWDFLLVLTELYPLFKDKNMWEEIGYRICKQIKEGIEKNGISINTLGMIGGIGYQTFLVQQYYKKTGNLKKFSESLNKALLQYASEKAKLVCKENKRTNAMDYDLIYGLSGNLYYLLDFQWLEKEKQQLLNIINYLVHLTETHLYKGKEVINFHLVCEEQFREDEKITFPNGNLNFGISHGMLGPLIALTKAYKKGFKEKNVENAIHKLFSLYEEFRRYDKQVPVWPTQLKYEDYISKRFTEDIRAVRAGWCYGNLGIARGLMKAADYMGDIKRKELYKRDLIKIFEQPWKDYHLNSSILCHGYASVLAVKNITELSEIGKVSLKQHEKEGFNRIIDEYMLEGYIKNSHDFSLLQGTAGIVLTVLTFFRKDLEFGKLLMID